MATAKAKGKRSRSSSSAKGTKGQGKTVARYLNSLEAGRRKSFQELRELVSKGLPAARETMSYGMPTWEIGGEVVCAAGSQKRYLALYFCEIPVLDRHRDAFAHLDIGKSCIRFREMQDLPVAVVKKMLREASKEVAARG